MRSIRLACQVTGLRITNLLIGVTGTLKSKSNQAEFSKQNVLKDTLM